MPWRTVPMAAKRLRNQTRMTSPKRTTAYATAARWHVTKNALTSIDPPWLATRVQCGQLTRESKYREKLISKSLAILILSNACSHLQISDSGWSPVDVPEKFHFMAWRLAWDEYGCSPLWRHATTCTLRTLISLLLFINRAKKRCAWPKNLGNI